jgi:predicted amidophosphoribosyltransferase
VLDVLLPRRCAVCARPGVPLCRDCCTAFVRLLPPVCERCGSPGAWPVRRCAECAGRRLGFATARGAILYDARAKAFVRSWKEHGRRDLARPAADLVAAAVPRLPADIITFVPGDRERGLKRGHSPPERLGRELGAIWELPAASLLVRLKPTPRQRGLGLQERRRNVAGAFGAIADVPRRIVLVDDIYTTGSTASACATALRKMGAERVDVVALSRAVR